MTCRPGLHDDLALADRVGDRRHGRGRRVAGGVGERLAVGRVGDEERGDDLGREGAARRRSARPRSARRGCGGPPPAPRRGADRAGRGRGRASPRRRRAPTAPVRGRRASCAASRVSAGRTLRRGRPGARSAALTSGANAASTGRERPGEGVELAARERGRGLGLVVVLRRHGVAGRLAGGVGLDRAGEDERPRGPHVGGGEVAHLEVDRPRQVVDGEDGGQPGDEQGGGHDEAHGVTPGEGGDAVEASGEHGDGRRRGLSPGRRLPCLGAAASWPSASWAARSARARAAATRPETTLPSARPRVRGLSQPITFPRSRADDAPVAAIASSTRAAISSSARAPAAGSRR